MVTFDTEIKETSHIDELEGKLASNPDEKRLMRSVLENDKETISDGKIVTEAVNRGISAMTPDLLFEQLVQNYSQAKNLYGETLLRESTGYEPGYIEKNIRIPEFQREIRQKIKDKFEQLKEKKLIDDESNITERAIKLASYILLAEELDKLAPKGIFGEKVRKKKDSHGLKENTKKFEKDRYRDLAIRKTIRKAIRRGHSRIEKDDLTSFEREGRGQNYIVFALDASGSMKGEKIDKSKKAGVALAYKAIENKDKVGLIVFGSEIKKSIIPSNDLEILLREIAGIRATNQTDLALTIKESIRLFPDSKVTKHLIILTDALPTKGDKPENAAYEAAFEAEAAGITISIVGIHLDDKGKKLGLKLAEIGNGRLFIVQNLDLIDQFVLEDYEEITQD